jgi:hypothetical protein
MLHDRGIDQHIPDIREHLVRRASSFAAVITQPRPVRISPSHAIKIRRNALGLGISYLGLCPMVGVWIWVSSGLAFHKTSSAGPAFAGGLGAFCLFLSAACLIGFRSCVVGEHLDLTGAAKARRVLVALWTVATFWSVVAVGLATVADRGPTTVTALSVIGLIAPSLFTGVVALVGRHVFKAEQAA